MTWTEYVLDVLMVIAVWFVWLWITQPKYEDGRYVTVRNRVCQILRRLHIKRDKPRADDTGV